MPTLYLAAENDTSTPLAGIRELFERTRATKRMVVLRRADHLHFLDDVEGWHERFRTMPVPEELAAVQREMRPIGELSTPGQAHLFARGLSLAHFDATLRGREEAKQFLESDLRSVLAKKASTRSSTVRLPGDGKEPRLMDILDAIGNTTMVRLRRLVPRSSAAVFAKLEWENPTGSMKDRMAIAVISRAEVDGRLKPGGTVVEYTGGSTGTSLAFVCAAKGYPIRIVTSDAFSKEKRDHMAALGAELTLVPSEGGLTTKKLILDMIEAARALSRDPNTFWTDQLNNRDAIAGYSPSPRRSGGRDREGSTPSSTASAPRPPCAASRKR